MSKLFVLAAKLEKKYEDEIPSTQRSPSFEPESGVRNTELRSLIIEVYQLLRKISSISEHMAGQMIIHEDELSKLNKKSLVILRDKLLSIIKDLN